MSLLIDALSKIKGGKKRKPVPPGLKKNRKNNNKSLLLLALFTVILSAIAVALFIFQDRLLQEDGNILSEIKTQKLPEATPKNPVKPEEKTVKMEKNTKEEIYEKSHQKTISTSKVKQLEQEPKPEINQTQSKKEEEKKPSSYMFSTYISLGNKYLEKKDYQKSLYYYKKAYQINPSQKLLKNIIILQIYTGRKETALAQLRKIKNPQHISQILTFLIQNGEVDFVRDFLDKEKKDSSGYISYTRGILEEKLGNTEKAFIYYKKAFEENPYDPYIAYAYARILEIKDLPDKALQVYKHINKISFSDNNLRKIVKDRIKLLGGSYE